MTAYVYRVSLVLPVAQRDAGRRVAEAMGWGPGNYSVPLSATGSAPATHYGLSTVATQAFVDMLAGAAQGAVPDGVDAADLAAVIPVLESLINSADVEGGAQFAALIGALSLQVIGDFT